MPPGRWRTGTSAWSGCGSAPGGLGLEVPARAGKAGAAASGSCAPTGGSPPGTSARSPPRSAPAEPSGAASSAREPGPDPPPTRLKNRPTAEGLPTHRCSRPAPDARRLKDSPPGDALGLQNPLQLQPLGALCQGRRALCAAGVQ